MIRRSLLGVACDDNDLGGVACNRPRGKHYNKVLVLIRLTSNCNYKKDETAFSMHSNSNVKTTTVQLLKKIKFYSVV